MIDGKKFSKKLRYIVDGLVGFIFVMLMFVVAYQQARIHTLDDKSTKHDEFITFMQEGERFTFLDGQALFYICTDGHTVSETIKQETWDLYLQHETSFSEWLRAQDKCQTE